jgi:hypothetical protein
LGPQLDGTPLVRLSRFDGESKRRRAGPSHGRPARERTVEHGAEVEKVVDKALGVGRTISKIRTLPPTLVLTMKLGGTFTAATPGCRVACVSTAIAEHG